MVNLLVRTAEIFLVIEQIEKSVSRKLNMNYSRSTILSYAILLFMAYYMCVHYYKMWDSDVETIPGILKLKISKQ